MYEEKRVSINWLKLILVVIIGFLVIVLSAKLVSIIFKNVDDKETTKSFETNLKLMNDAGRAYYVEDKLPSEVGQSAKVTLKELVEAGKLSEIKDKDGEACIADESYVEITKLENEYQLKSYLACKTESDYMNSFIEDASKLIIIKPETTTTTTKQPETTTTTTQAKVVPTTTTKAKITYTVGFNVNGGHHIDSRTVEAGEKLVYPIPVREGYKFVGWYSNGEPWNYDTPIHRNIVLTAKWTVE